MNKTLTKVENEILETLLPQNRDVLEPMIEKWGEKETVRRIVLIKSLTDEQLDIFIELAKEMLKIENNMKGGYWVATW